MRIDSRSKSVRSPLQAVVDRIAARPAWRPYALVALGLFGLQLLLQFVGFLTNEEWRSTNAERYEVSGPIAAIIGGVDLADRSIGVLGADLLATLALLFVVRRFWGEAQTTTVLSLAALAAIVSVIFSLIGIALSATGARSIYLGYLLLDPAALVIAGMFWSALPQVLAVSNASRNVAVAVFLAGSYGTSFVDWFLLTSALRLFGE